MNETIITSKANPLIKEAVKLKQKKYRSLMGKFILDGYHLVNEALAKGLVERVFYVESCEIEGVEKYRVSALVMESLSDVVQNQGIVAICKKPEKMEIGNKVLILDNVQDPGNIGTLIRSCAAFGFDTIIAENSVDFYNDKVIRSTQGALFKVNLISSEIGGFIDNHPDFDIYATDLKSQRYLDEMKITAKKIAIILGNEGSGVSQEILTKVNNSFKLKMSNMESLNVGVAGSIILYELSKRSL